MLLESPTYAALFVGKELSDRVISKYDGVSQNAQSWISGWIGGFFSTIVSCPTELLKIRAQNNYQTRTNYFKLAQNLVREQGFSSMYKGYLSLVVRDVPGFVAYFGVFEIGMNSFTKPNDSWGRILAFQILFGSWTGIASWLLPYPIDVAKSMIQVSDSSLTMRKIFVDNYRKHGWKFFFKGALATSLRAIPMECTCLVVYYQLREQV